MVGMMNIGQISSMNDRKYCPIWMIPSVPCERRKYLLGLFRRPSRSRTHPIAPERPGRFRRRRLQLCRKTHGELVKGWRVGAVGRRSSEGQKKR
jgi:hypothetical protein